MLSQVQVPEADKVHMLGFPKDSLALQNLPNGLDLKPGLGGSRMLTSLPILYLTHALAWANLEVYRIVEWFG